MSGRKRDGGVSCQPRTRVLGFMACILAHDSGYDNDDEEEEDDTVCVLA